MLRRLLDPLKADLTSASRGRRAYQKLGAIGLVALVVALAIFAMTRADAPSAPGAPGASNPHLSARRYDPLDLPTYRATVKQVLRAGSYRYLLLDGAPGGAPGQAWVVVMGQDAAPGERVEATLWAQLDDFSSPKLGRRFAPLQLATITSVTPRNTP